MHALIVHCHPEPRSFNAALRDVALESLQRRGWTVEVSDLYPEGFEPVEGPARYPDRADPELFAPLVEQRHAWQAGPLPADVQREIERLERAPAAAAVPTLVARAAGNAEGLVRPGIRQRRPVHQPHAL